MSSFRKYPLFSAALSVCALVALGEGWCIYERWHASREAAATLEKKKTELHAMGALAPAPTREISKTIESDLARAQRALDAMQGELKGRGPAAERLRTAKAPTARTDAYFDLATFVEKTRELAKTREVELKPEAARFGFSLYANEGPEAERIPAVFHQRQVAQYIIESLLDARPRALLALQREAPLTKKEKEDRDAAALAVANGAPPSPDAATPTLPEGPDFFAIDPRASARVPGYLDATAFRVSFVGQTTALRTFLNKLASFELPVLVREVEVDPAAAADIAAPTPTPDDATAVATPDATSIVLTTKAAPAKSATKMLTAKPAGASPIVAKPWCKFTVTVEYIELVAPTIADAATDAAKPTT